MCGILSILMLKPTDSKIFQFILDGLYQIQNRGYDSSGFCILDENSFLLRKFASTDEKSSLVKLAEEVKLLDRDTYKNAAIGISHVRWATHGKKTDINSHPHVSSCGNFALVHNGIIENFEKLKSFLIEKNYTFLSETDTEIIVNLISYFSKETQNTADAIKLAIQNLEGTFAISLLHRRENNKLYCFRRGSPLLVGIGDETIIISSEESGFCGLIDNYITLENEDLCIMSRENEKISIQTTQTYKQKEVSKSLFDLTPEPFKHWLLKEIFEQPKSILNSLNNGGRIKSDEEVKLGGLERCFETLKDVNNIILLGCGTSYFAGSFASNIFKNISNFNTVQVIDGADFEYKDVPRGVDQKTALILISQSGETKDLYRCIEIARENNLITIGVVNGVNSLIAREVTCGIYLNAGREVSVASTKSFTSQIVCLTLMAVWFAQIRGINVEKRTKIIADLKRLSNDIYIALDKTQKEIKDLAQKITNSKFDHIFVLGKGNDEAIAREAALKIKEVSYLHAEAYSASALKHGPFALLTENLPVILLNCDPKHDTKLMNCHEEIKARAAPIYFLTHQHEILNTGTIHTSAKNETFSSLLALIPLQLLAYYLAIFKKIDPDRPRNLAKVVTVE